MKLDVPIYVESHRGDAQSASAYSVGLVFFPQNARQHRLLASATWKLAAELKQQLERMARAGEHQQVAEYAFDPGLQLEAVEVRLDLRQQTLHVHLPVVTFRHLERRLAFSLAMPELWFEVPRGETLRSRLQEVYEHHLRKRRSEGDDVAVQPLLGYTRKRRVWLSHIEIDLEVERELPPRAAPRMIVLGGEGPLRGEDELERVGRCITRLYPDGLDRFARREELVAEFTSLVDAADSRPILLAGAPQVGKTALIHEFLFRRLTERRQAFRWEDQVWLLAPQRLISGMSIVGQWENRLLAILKTARRRRLVLYFDDLVGLCRAGHSASSTLSVADVLKPYIERREVRVLAECTPEQLRVLRELDRGLADLFHVLPVDQPSEEETLRILLAVVRGAEARFGCRFDPEVLPTVLGICRHYQRDAAFPGKAAGLLKQIARKHEQAEITRAMVLTDFQTQTGLNRWLLDTQFSLARDDIVDALRRRIVGQRGAVEAMADVVSVAKARLNDPARPLGTLLFLGPTGVGKTESAKALAEYLYGDAERLLRFDMNEYVAPQSVPRLIGTLGEPEGLLTSAIRRQPFAVVLFDEIEKAHPDVFDLLLQILGEARLTDALGRTADFSGAIVVLTSNLGTREAAGQLGFGAGSAAGDEQVYLRAVRDFFRPEFFNRLDRIVPFSRLDRGELARIAERLLAGIVVREGMSRKRCALELDRDTVEWLVDRGYHPTLGARAMKRALEKDLVQPVGAAMAAVTPETPVVLQVQRRGERLLTHVEPLLDVRPHPSLVRKRPPFADPDGLLRRVRAALDGAAESFRSHRPAGELSTGSLRPEHYTYAASLELIGGARALLGQIDELRSRPRRRSSAPSLPPRQPRIYSRSKESWEGYPVVAEIFAARDVEEYLDDLAGRVRTGNEESLVDNLLAELLDRVALLAALQPGEEGWRHERALMVLRSTSGADAHRQELATLLEQRYLDVVPGDADSASPVFSFTVDRYAARGDQRNPWWSELADDTRQRQLAERYAIDVLVVSGQHAERFTRTDEGTHLFSSREGLVVPVQVAVRALPEGQGVAQAVADLLDEHQRAIDSSTTELSWADSPFRWQSVVAIYRQQHGLWLDMRTGRAAAGAAGLDPAEALLASLPLPGDLT